MTERIEQFERMLSDVQARYASIVQNMETLRQNGKEKSATFRQLMGDKLLYQNILSMYKIYGLLDSDREG